MNQKLQRAKWIARIDPRDYEVKVADIEAQLARARASAKRAASEYDRELRMFKDDPGATSQRAQPVRQHWIGEERNGIKPPLM